MCLLFQHRIWSQVIPQGVCIVQDYYNMATGPLPSLDTYTLGSHEQTTLHTSHHRRYCPLPYLCLHQCPVVPKILCFLPACSAPSMTTFSPLQLDSHPFESNVCSKFVLYALICHHSHSSLMAGKIVLALLPIRCSCFSHLHHTSIVH